jgi:hypothetical protein
MTGRRERKREKSGNSYFKVKCNIKYNIKAQSKFINSQNKALNSQIYF